MDDATQISKMKVADLKKELKARGLAVTGNKTELVERLQEALETDGNVPLGQVEGEAGEDEEFDEEEILGGDDDDMDSADLGKLTPQEEEAALGVISVKDEAELLEQPKKKITLKRTEPSSLPTPTPTTEATKENTEPESSTQEDEKDAPTARKIIKLDNNVTEKPSVDVPEQKVGLTDDAKKQARAQRFKITAGTETTGDDTTAKKPSKLSMETGGTDIAKLKARAERFGEVTSKSLTKVSELEKKKQRSERFAAAGGEVKTEGTEKKLITSLDDAKTARAARFGISGGTDDELKKKRAARFAAQ